MSTYAGTFTVLNNTRGSISSITVSHQTSEFGNNTYSNSGSMGNLGMSGTTPLTTSTSNTDHWTVSFTNSQGQVLTGSNNCGFESEDNGGNVVVILNATNFGIINPASSSHTSNDYDQG